jgi:hypothetical protein
MPDYPRTHHGETQYFTLVPYYNLRTRVNGQFSGDTVSSTPVVSCTVSG